MNEYVVSVVSRTNGELILHRGGLQENCKDELEAIEKEKKVLQKLEAEGWEDPGEFWPLKPEQYFAVTRWDGDKPHASYCG